MTPEVKSREPVAAASQLFFEKESFFTVAV
jgi:hypothetical protein